MVDKIFKKSSQFRWVANFVLVVGFLIFAVGCFIFYSADLIASKAQTELLKKVENISK